MKRRPFLVAVGATALSGCSTISGESNYETASSLVLELEQVSDDGWGSNQVPAEEVRSTIQTYDEYSEFTRNQDSSDETEWFVSVAGIYDSVEEAEGQYTDNKEYEQSGGKEITELDFANQAFLSTDQFGVYAYAMFQTLNAIGYVHSYANMNTIGYAKTMFNENY